MASEIAELVSRLYEALARGDPAAVEELLDPGFEGQLAEGLPAGLGGRREGALEMRDEGWWAFGRRFACAREPQEWIECADGRLLVLGRYVGSARATGKPLDAAFAHVWSAAGRAPDRRLAADGHRAVGSGARVKRRVPHVDEGVDQVVRWRAACTDASHVALHRMEHRADEDLRDGPALRSRPAPLRLPGPRGSGRRPARPSPRSSPPRAARASASDPDASSSATISAACSRQRAALACIASRSRPARRAGITLVPAGGRGRASARGSRPAAQRRPPPCSGSRSRTPSG